MSLIRNGEKRKYSNGKPTLYVYPCDIEEKVYLEGFIDEKFGKILSCEDFCELLFRTLDEAKVPFSEETVASVRRVLTLPRLNKEGSG